MAETGLSFLTGHPDKWPSIVAEHCRAAWSRWEADHRGKWTVDGLDLAEVPAAEITFLAKLLDRAAETRVPPEELPAFLSLCTLPSAMRWATPHLDRRKMAGRWPSLDAFRISSRATAAVRAVALALEEQDAFWFERVAEASWASELNRLPITWPERLALGYTELQAERCYRIHLFRFLPPDFLAPSRPKPRGGRAPRARSGSGLTARLDLVIGFAALDAQLDPMSWEAGTCGAAGKEWRRILRIRVTVRRAARAAHGELVNLHADGPEDHYRELADREGTRVPAGVIPPEFILKSAYLLRCPAHTFPSFVGASFRDLREVLPIDATPAELELMLAIAWRRSARSLTEAERQSGGVACATGSAATNVFTGSEEVRFDRKVERLFAAVQPHYGESETGIDVAKALRAPIDLLCRRNDRGGLVVPWLRAGLLKESLAALARPTHAATDTTMATKGPDDPVLEGETAASRGQRVSDWLINQSHGGEALGVDEPSPDERPMVDD